MTLFEIKQLLVDLTRFAFKLKFNLLKRIPKLFILYSLLINLPQQPTQEHTHLQNVLQRLKHLRQIQKALFNLTIQISFM